MDTRVQSKIVLLEQLHWLFSYMWQGCSKWSGWLDFGQITISQGKNKIPFYKKQQINKNTRVIFEHVQCVIDIMIQQIENAYDEAESNQPPMHTRMFYAMDGILLHKNYVPDRVRKSFVGLIDLEQHTNSKRQTSHMSYQKTYQPPMHLITQHMLRVKSGLISCEDLSTALHVFHIQYTSYVAIQTVM